jgi:hypothetical protein
VIVGFTTANEAILRNLSECERPTEIKNKKSPSVCFSSPFSSKEEWGKKDLGWN